MTIDEFRGQHAFLSNFTDAEVVLDGVTYRSVECAYQAAKTTDVRQRVQFERCAAAVAKRCGRRLHLRLDWEAVKLGVMEGLLRQKFARDPHRALLEATGDATLVEGNWWGDAFWGVCRGEGENHLGRLLMKIRAEARLTVPEVQKLVVDHLAARGRPIAPTALRRELGLGAALVDPALAGLAACGLLAEVDGALWWAPASTGEARRIL